MLRLHSTCLVGLLLVANVAHAQPPRAAEDPLELVRLATEPIAKAQAFTAEFELAAKIGLPGVEHGRYVRYQVTAARPNRFALVRIRGDLGATVVSDGHTLTQYVPELSQYTSSPAPDSLDEFSTSVTNMMLLEGGMGGFLMAMFADDPFARLTTGVKQSQYLGQQEVDGLPCHHVRLVQEDWDIDLWITAGDQPRLRRIRPDLSRQLDQEQQDTGFSIVISLEYEDWNFSPQLADHAFDFTPPATAEQVDQLSARRPPPVAPPIVARHPLVGQPAPEFSLPVLDRDQPVRLEDLVGKQVVVLDFWATWCPPCVEALPQLAKLAEQYDAEQVRVLAINLEEKPETIRQFLDQQQIELPVLLDADGSVFKQYEVAGIPQTVLIGLDGRVQVVHAGLGDGLPSKLGRQIDALLRREDLTGDDRSDASSDATDSQREPPSQQ